MQRQRAVEHVRDPRLEDERDRGPRWRPDQVERGEFPEEQKHGDQQDARGARSHDPAVDERAMTRPPAAVTCSTMTRYNSLAQFQVPRIAAGSDLVARIGQRHADHLRNSAGRGGQHDDLPEIERLVEIVRDEQDRQSKLLPEVQQEVLQLDTHHGIERTERLVHQQAVRRRASARAIATRCCMPSES